MSVCKEKTEQDRKKEKAGGGGGLKSDLSQDGLLPSPYLKQQHPSLLIVLLYLS